MIQAIWQESSSQCLTAELDGMQLAVSRIGEGRTVRFLIWKQMHFPVGLCLVQSGHRDSLEQAMRAAEYAACVLSFSYLS